jgi:hypothetical protein
MSARFVLEPFSDPSIKVDLLLFAKPGHPRVPGIDFEERRQMTVEDEGVETSLLDVDHSPTRRLMGITQIGLPLVINLLRSHKAATINMWYNGNTT